MPTPAQTESILQRCEVSACQAPDLKRPAPKSITVEECNADGCEYQMRAAFIGDLSRDKTYQAIIDPEEPHIVPRQITFHLKTSHLYFGEWAHKGNIEEYVRHPSCSLGAPDGPLKPGSAFIYEMKSAYIEAEVCITIDDTICVKTNITERESVAEFADITSVQFKLTSPELATILATIYDQIPNGQLGVTRWAVVTHNKMQIDHCDNLEFCRVLKKGLMEHETGKGAMISQGVSASGNTSLTEYVQYILSEKGWDPDSNLCIRTFNDKQECSIIDECSGFHVLSVKEKYGYLTPRSMVVRTQQLKVSPRIGLDLRSDIHVQLNKVKLNYRPGVLKIHSFVVTECYIKYYKPGNRICYKMKVEGLSDRYPISSNLPLMASVLQLETGDNTNCISFSSPDTGTKTCNLCVYTRDHCADANEVYIDSEGATDGNNTNIDIEGDTTESEHVTLSMLFHQWWLVISYACYVAACSLIIFFLCKKFGILIAISLYMTAVSAASLKLETPVKGMTCHYCTKARVDITQQCANVRLVANSKRTITPWEQAQTVKFSEDIMLFLVPAGLSLSVSTHAERCYPNATIMATYQTLVVQSGCTAVGYNINGIHYEVRANGDSVLFSTDKCTISASAVLKRTIPQRKPGNHLVGEFSYYGGIPTTRNMKVVLEKEMKVTGDVERVVCNPMSTELPSVGMCWILLTNLYSNVPGTTNRKLGKWNAGIPNEGFLVTDDTLVPIVHDTNGPIVADCLMLESDRTVCSSEDKVLFTSMVGIGQPSIEHSLIRYGSNENSYYTVHRTVQYRFKMPGCGGIMKYSYGNMKCDDVCCAYFQRKDGRTLYKEVKKNQQVALTHSISFFDEGSNNVIVRTDTGCKYTTKWEMLHCYMDNNPGEFSAMMILPLLISTAIMGLWWGCKRFRNICAFRTSKFHTV